MEKIQLLPRHKFSLLVFGDGGQEFVNLFRSSWKQIPIKSRRSILAFWNQSEIPQYPSFELSDMWLDSKDSFAQVGSKGMVLRFSASDFTVLPRRIAEWIVAHELAHVYQKAIGRLPGGTNEFENEADANKIAESWGFTQAPMTMLKLLMRNRKLSIEEAVKEIIHYGLA